MGIFVMWSAAEICAGGAFFDTALFHRFDGGGAGDAETAIAAK